MRNTYDFIEDNDWDDDLGPDLDEISKSKRKKQRRREQRNNPKRASNEGELSPYNNH
ncbi:hypothetical protein ACVBIL_20420 [Shewanella sp. 125m-7]